jgi:hypothetical protein
MKVKLSSRLRMAVTECVSSPVPNTSATRLKLPFIAVRTGEVPVEPAMSAPSEPESFSLGLKSKSGWSMAQRPEILEDMPGSTRLVGMLVVHLGGDLGQDLGRSFDRRGIDVIEHATAHAGQVRGPG